MFTLGLFSHALDFKPARHALTPFEPERAVASSTSPQPRRVRFERDFNFALLRPSRDGLSGGVLRYFLRRPVPAQTLTADGDSALHVGIAVQ